MDGPDAIERAARTLYEVLSARGHCARPWAPTAVYPPPFDQRARPWAPTAVYQPPFDQLPLNFQEDYRAAAAAALALPEGGQERMAV